METSHLANLSTHTHRCTRHHKLSPRKPYLRLLRRSNGIFSSDFRISRKKCQECSDRSQSHAPSPGSVHSRRQETRRLRPAKRPGSTLLCSSAPAFRAGWPTMNRCRNATAHAHRRPQPSSQQKWECQSVAGPRSNLPLTGTR